MAERKSLKITEAHMLAVGDRVRLERFSDSFDETSVEEIRRNGREVQLSLRSGGQPVVISIRKGGIWLDKGSKNFRCGYTVYKL